MSEPTAKQIAIAEKQRKRREKRRRKKIVEGTQYPVDISPATGMDVFNDLTSSIQSMANPALRLAERATQTGYFDKVMREQEESVARGRRLRQDLPYGLGSGGYPIGDPVGEIAGGVALTKGQGVAPTMAQRMFVQAPATAAALGPAFAPTDVDTTSAMNTGAKYGLLMGPAFEGARKGVEVGGPFLRHIFASPKNRAAHMLDNLLGGQKPAVANALRNTKSRVAGERLTAGEAAVPAKSPQMSVLQKMVDEEMPKKYSDINAANRAARRAAIEQHGGNVRGLRAERTAATASLREQALSSANKTGALKSEGIIQSIDDALTDKMIPSLQRKALEDVKKNILSRTDEASGVIDANALYTVRKEIGNTLESIFSKEGVRWDKALVGRMSGKIQKIIDNSIEAAGGRGWKEYLRTYTEKSIPIENAQLGNKLTQKLQSPLGKEQSTTFASAVTRNPKTRPNNQRLQVSTDEVVDSLQRRADLQTQAMSGVMKTREAMNAPHLPNTGMFSPAYQVTKSVINRFSDRLTRGVMRELANAFDDPKKTLELLAKTDLPGPVQTQLLALSKQASIASAIALEKTYAGSSIHPH